MAKNPSKAAPMPLKVSQTALKALDRMSASTERIRSLQSGVSGDLIKAGSSLDDLQQSINRSILKTYNNFVGLGHDYSAQEVNQILALTQKGASVKKSDMKKVVADFKKTVSSNDRTQEILKVRKEYKSSLFSSYELIVNVIPKMRLALNTIANSIMSPDDFSKKSLSVFFDQKGLTPQAAIEVQRRLKTIMDKHDIEKDLKEDVVDTLVKGEKFWAILSVNQEIRSLLKEAATEKNQGYRTLHGECRKMLNESYATPQEALILEEGIQLFSEDRSKPISRDVFAADLDEFLGENLVIGNSDQFLAEHVSMTEELSVAAAFKKDDRGVAIDDVDEAAIDGLKFKEDSAILKKLKADQVVKLEYGGKVYGYVYVDSVENESPINGAKSSSQAGPQAPQNTVAAGVQGVVHSSSDIDKGIAGEKNSSLMDPKLKYIADVFVNRLSRKENIRILKRSETLKHAIYHSLVTKRISKDEKLRVIFFTPDEVIHIDRKESIFDNVLFFAKLYIATLITILMQNIVRGADKRAYYIDIGLENDAANAINSVIRDIKSKELSNVHNMDMSSMLNILGEFNDYYIPSIDGEKPIEISTVDGLQNISLDNEFLNWLSNNIFSGIGLPSAYLTEVENIDFAKTLAMQNARFIRDIVSEQTIFGYGYSELLKKLYLKEFGDSEGEESGLKLFNIETIEVKFPSPAALNMTNLNDQIGNLETLVNSIGDVLDIPAASKDAAIPIFKREMYRKYLPNLDWEEIDEILRKVKRKIGIENLAKKTGTEDAAGAGGEEGTDDEV